MRVSSTRKSTAPGRPARQSASRRERSRIVARREERIRALRKHREQPAIRIMILGFNWCGAHDCKLCPDQYPHQDLPNAPQSVAASQEPES